MFFLEGLYTIAGALIFFFFWIVRTDLSFGSVWFLGIQEKSALFSLCCNENMMLLGLKKGP